VKNSQRERYVPDVAGWDDDEDWVGEPPEGRYTRDRADPGYWRRIPPLAAVGGAGVVLALVVLVLVLLLR
jgi:hypothetical protein